MKKAILSVLVIASTVIGMNAQNAQSVMPTQGQPAMQAAPGQPAGMQGQPVKPMMPPAPEERAKRMTEHLNQMVKLTDEQTKKVMDLYKEMATKQDDLRKEAQAAGAGASIGPKFKELSDNTDAKLKTILTPEQYAKYEESRKPKMNAMPGAKPGMAPTAAPAATPATPDKK